MVHLPMNHQPQRELDDRRGLRFPFDANAEVVPETSSKSIPARVTELSFRGCYLEMPAGLKEQQRVLLRIAHSNDHFEASAIVLYVRPAGVGLVFGEIQPQYRHVLQSWILSGLDSQAAANHS